MRRTTERVEVTTSIEIDVRAEVTILPGAPGVRTFNNGDPGYPGHGPEIDTVRFWIVLPGGREVELTEKEADAFVCEDDWNYLSDAAIEKYENGGD